MNTKTKNYLTKNLAARHDVTAKIGTPHYNAAMKTLTVIHSDGVYITFTDFKNPDNWNAYQSVLKG